MSEHIELNEYGRLVFRHYANKNLFLHRPFKWQDRIMMLHESDKGRQHIQDFKFSTFDLTGWIPVTKEEDEKVKGNYTEIYENNG